MSTAPVEARRRRFRITVQAFFHASGNVVDLALGIGGCDLGVGGGLLGARLHLLGGLRGLLLDLLIGLRRSVVTAGESDQCSAYGKRCPSPYS